MSTNNVKIELIRQLGATNSKQELKRVSQVLFPAEKAKKATTAKKTATAKKATTAKKTATAKKATTAKKTATKKATSTKKATTTKADRAKQLLAML